MVDVYRRMVEAVDVPVNADGEKGYGAPDDVSETAKQLIEAGTAGMNLEDGAHRVAGEPRTLIDIELARDKITALIETRQALKSEFFLNARVDALMVYEDREAALAEAIERGNAYAELGADCIFFTNAGDADNIGLLAKEVKAPISILAGANSPPPRELEELGVARVSYGTSFFLQSLVGVKALSEILLAKDNPAEQLRNGVPGTEVAKIVRSSR
jgi:2-methylisocitrate lyase-like PEP mutase family enzyme